MTCTKQFDINLKGHREVKECIYIGKFVYFGIILTFLGI